MLNIAMVITLSLPGYLFCKNAVSKVSICSSNGIGYFFNICRWCLLSSLLAGCAHYSNSAGNSNTADNDLDISIPALGVVKVISAPGQSTEIESVTTTAFQWDAVGRGAARGMRPCLNIGAQGGSTELLQWLGCFPVTALIGAISGFASEPAPLQPNMDDLIGFFESGEYQALINKYVAHSAVDSGIDAVIPFENPDRAPIVPRVVADTYIEIWVKKVQMNYDARGGSRLVVLAVTMDVSVRHVGHDELLKQFEMAVESDPHAYSYWLSDDYTSLRLFIRDAAQQLIELTLANT